MVFVRRAKGASQEQRKASGNWLASIKRSTCAQHNDPQHSTQALFPIISAAAASIASPAVSRRSVSSANSSTGGSRCSSRSSSASGSPTAAAAAGLQPEVGDTDELASEYLVRQTVRAHLYRHKQPFDQQQHQRLAPAHASLPRSPGSIFQRVDKYLTQARQSASSDHVAQHSSSACVTQTTLPRRQQLAKGHCSESSGAFKLVGHTAAARQQQQAANSKTARNSPLASYVSFVRASSASSLLQSRFANRQGASPNAHHRHTQADSQADHHRDHSLWRHHNNAAGPKRRATSTLAEGLFAPAVSLFGQVATSHHSSSHSAPPPAGSNVIHLVRRELSKILKSL